MPDKITEELVEIKERLARIEENVENIEKRLDKIEQAIINKYPIYILIVVLSFVAVMFGLGWRPP